MAKAIRATTKRYLIFEYAGALKAADETIEKRSLSFLI